MKVRILAGLVAAIVAQTAFSQQRITQADLLERVVDLERLSRPAPAGTRTRMFSSYDRRARIDADGRYVDWDANHDCGEYIRRTEDGWDVMAELEGPGAITRIWSANPHGDLRVVLDGEPVIDTTFDRLMSGDLPPFQEPLVFRGLDCYFPIGFNESCLVVCRNSTAYYQINTVQFPPGTQVQRFAFELDQPALDALAHVSAVLTEGVDERDLGGTGRTMPVAVFEELGPGEVLSERLDGAGTVRALYVALTDRADPREPYSLHRCILRIFADGENNPSVEAPLCDFFGSGFELVPFNSLPLGTNRRLELPLPDRRMGEDRFMYCYFPMPYRAGLRVEIENLNDTRRPIGLLLHMRVETAPPAQDALRFRARFRKEDPCQVLDYPILEAAGRGRIVGCLLNVDCPRPIWWGEGDDKVWIDGERFPSYFGTGSEDYLGDAWGLHHFIRPLVGVTRAAPYGKNSAYRWHLPDAISFQRSVRFTIENWQFGGHKDTYYSTVAYWYGPPASDDLFHRLELADVTPPGLRIPDSVEVEYRVLGSDWGNIIKQKHAGGSELSAEQAANITTESPVRIRIPSESARTVVLKLRVNPRRSFETITVTADDGRRIGTVTYDRAPDGIYRVGILRLEKGDNLVSVQCTRAAQLDCWVLEDVPRSGRGPEAEDLEVVGTDGATCTSAYEGGDWSGGGGLVADFTSEGQTLQLRLPPRDAEAACALSVRLGCGPAGGRFQALLDDQPVGGPFDTFGPEPALRWLRLDTVLLAAGAHRLGFRALPSDPRSEGRRLELDVIGLIPVVSRHALECEELAITGEEGSHNTLQDIGGASGGRHVWCRATEPGAWIEFKVPIEQAGRYRLSAVYTCSFDYGVVQAYVNGEKAGDPTDTYAPRITPLKIVPLGVFDLPAGPVRIRIEVTGKAERSPGYYFGVDSVIAQPAGQG